MVRREPEDLLYEAVTVSVERAMFEKASDGEPVNGKVYANIEGKQEEALVYIILGKRQKYRKRAGDSQKVDYKYFTGCIICVAETEEDLHNPRGANWKRTLQNRPVVLAATQKA